MISYDQPMDFRDILKYHIFSQSQFMSVYHNGISVLMRRSVDWQALFQYEIGLGAMLHLSTRTLLYWFDERYERYVAHLPDWFVLRS